MRILVCGGRDFGDLKTPRNTPDRAERVKEYHFVLEKLYEIAKERSKEFKPDDNWLPSDIEIISGCATGPDSVAIDWAVCNWCAWYEYPADWKKYGKRAGFIRNSQMLKEGKPDLVIAFPGGRGTAMMVELSQKAGVETVIVPYK